MSLPNTNSRRRLRLPEDNDPIFLMAGPRVSSTTFVTLWLVVTAVVFGLMLGWLGAVLLDGVH